MSNVLSDQLTMTGLVHYELFNEDGVLIVDRWEPNVVTTVGKRHVADRLASSQDEAAMSHMAVGTGTTPASVDDTALQTEIARVALTSRLQLAASDAHKVQYVATFGPGVGTGNITEGGILNASSNGVLFAHQVFDAIDKGVNDTLTITWTVAAG